ncbi:hypothetical protein BB559_006066 [Furculomyces boomerangus]|uniref:Uncharacterized protein n=1 Tax=Furculomyces boomerangus TaxID=61424 RepID=A0A2T9Y4Z2_9FUNG|nr:hypothetical protein BB559_006066 [Furculomyces boomerangus]
MRFVSLANFAFSKSLIANFLLCERDTFPFHIIVKFPDFQNGKVFLNLVKDGIVEANDFYQPKKYNEGCTNNCLYEIKYNNEKPPIYFNMLIGDYVFGDDSFYLSFQNKFTKKGCTEVQSCGGFVLPFNREFEVENKE